MALKKSILSALAALLLLTSAQGGQAEELTGTLKKIKEIYSYLLKQMTRENVVYSTL